MTKGQIRMDAYERLRATAITMIVRDTPAQFWIDLRELSKITYADVFADVATDRNVLPDQKIDDLLQRRHFRMEKLLIDLAAKYGMSHSMSLIVQNNRRHAYVFKDEVAMTQSYVQAIGSMPQPAKFRERLANAMDLPRLDLGDEPDGAFIMPNVYGVIAHNPVGRRFNADEQKLGTIQLCVPARDFKAWAVELSITEILAAYPEAPKKSAPKRSLRWKKPKDDEGTGTDGQK
ncbi:MULTISPECIES: hypothetical protein [unclassified Novosphingobium]|uniref:hypothetical protein n=1 Tax=unclassified Novosphingobium TaxID=2644732 RepID=UPI0025EB8B8D|nr:MULTISPECIES: hypothetical protein [unclassified Novosphingobium]HQV03455.1 hypothetical protein [Novosphingobium sp.]